MSQSSEITSAHLQKIAAFYDAAPTELNSAARSYRGLLAHYYNLLIPSDASVLEIGCGSGELLARIHASRKVGIDLSARQISAARIRIRIPLAIGLTAASLGAMLIRRLRRH